MTSLSSLFQDHARWDNLMLALSCQSRWNQDFILAILAYKQGCVHHIYKQMHHIMRRNHNVARHSRMTGATLSPHQSYNNNYNIKYKVTLLN